jgi:periplasmic protein CpxP/Spy
MTDKEPTEKKRYSRKGKGIAFLAGTVAIVGSAFAFHAFADTNSYAHMKLMSGDMGAWHGSSHHGGKHGGHHGGFSNMSEAEFEAKVERMVKHLAIEIDATDEQQDKITELVTAFAADMKPIREQMRTTREEIRELLVADEIDRAALEEVRATGIAEAERISKDLVDAVADVAEVLTAEQRELLNERLKEFRPRGGGRHRG